MAADNRVGCVSDLRAAPDRPGLQELSLTFAQPLSASAANLAIAQSSVGLPDANSLQIFTIGELAGGIGATLRQQHSQVIMLHSVVPRLDPETTGQLVGFSVIGRFWIPNAHYVGVCCGVVLQRVAAWAGLSTGADAFRVERPPQAVAS